MFTAAKSFNSFHRLTVVSGGAVSRSSDHVNSEAGRTCNCINMRIRRIKRCYIALLAAPALLLILYVTGYSPLLYGQNPSVHRPHIPFEEVAHLIDHSKPRIMVTWFGRMGNHMFQYSTLIGVAKRNNMTPIIPPNIDLLDVFDLPTPQGSNSLLRDPITYPDEMPAKYDVKTEHLDRGRDAFLKGYHQSWRYYQNVRDELLDKHFVFHKPILHTALSYISGVRSQLNKPDSVLISVHVRRGDFVRQRIKGFTAAPVPYYYKAMNYFRRKYKNVLFIICTNDIFWAQDHLDIGPDIHYSTNTDGAVDLAIMANSDHVIITSGSFSWWAGYLVRGEVVYYHGFPEPNTIIGNKTVRADYYPPHWKPM
ncbi:galactoside alpha-(1,2)-fucosyltransferase 2-like [Babylonia areolata]|uniref:galactoside alpha-(1,2)-fucosyltransferase 2-like n=1 Tax=Babylonia areolata TaxID=304850 RepID=UPI003FD3C5C9